MPLLLGHDIRLIHMYSPHAYSNGGPDRMRELAKTRWLPQRSEGSLYPTLTFHLVLLRHLPTRSPDTRTLPSVASALARRGPAGRSVPTGCTRRCRHRWTWCIFLVCPRDTGFQAVSPSSSCSRLSLSPFSFTSSHGALCFLEVLSSLTSRPTRALREIRSFSSR